jgi:hypothetical protein
MVGNPKGAESEKEVRRAELNKQSGVDEADGSFF